MSHASRPEHELVRRPLKRAEYGLVFISRQAEKGWKDSLAAYRNAMVEAWERLSTDPTREDGQRVYRLKGGDLGNGVYDGRTYDRYQYKLPGGCRIWYFVQAADTRKEKFAGYVLVEDVHTRHPNQTK